jgi:hypothetical protein
MNSQKYEIVETIDGEYMILIHGVQWGPYRDKSGAGSATFKTRKAARMQLATFYMEDRRIALENGRYN